MALYATASHAGNGFLLRSQSATTLGTAQAGMATITDDVSGMVFNPALLGYVKGQELTFGFTPIVSSGHFDPSSATTFVGTPIAGNSGGEPGLFGSPVNLYYARRLTDSFTAGLAMTSMYGLGYEWDAGWVGRYHALKSELLTFDIVPALAYNSGPWSLGLGVDIRYSRSKTTTSIDFGSIAFAFTGGAVGIPGGNDGSLTTKLDDWSAGVIVGATFEPVPGETRIGLSYRSKISTTLKGPATFDTGGPVGQAIAAASGQFQNSDSSAPLDYPAAVIVGFSQKLSPKLTLLADVQWTQWSSLQSLRLSFANPAQQEVVTPLDWRDCWFVAAGLRYEYDDKWIFRGGVAYDQTPTRHETSTPAIPDANSFWVDIGLSYKINDNWKFDAAYGHIFVRDNPIALQATSATDTRGNLFGTITGSAVDFVGIQLTYRF